MKLKVKSNGNVVEMKSEIFKRLPSDMKLGYDVLSKEDAPEKKDQPVKNEAKVTPPDTGQKKGDKK